MTQGSTPPLDNVQRQEIGRKHLAKALTKALPIVGDVISEMVFETAKDEADTRDMKELKAALAEIQTSQSAADTDLGDVLRGLEQLSLETHQMRDALKSLLLYFQGQADSTVIHQVETAAERVLPGYTAAAIQSENATTVDRYTLSRAIEKLQPDEWVVVIGDIPTANRVIYGATGMAPQINKLLEWAEGINGPGLNRIYTLIKRRYPNFKLNP